MTIHPDDVWAIRAALWPGVRFYPKQVEMIEAAITSRELYVVAANKVGKDYGFGFLALACATICAALDVQFRIVTTSVDASHFAVLWSEIGKFFTRATQPLTQFKLTHCELRRSDEIDLTGTNAGSYVSAKVSKHGEGLSGHHAPFTLTLGDESSAIDDQVKDMVDGWSQHQVWFGNPNACRNFWRKGFEAGDLVAVGGGGITHARRSIRIAADDSPNVARGLAMRAAGREPDGENVIPGLLSWEEYEHRRATWDAERQTVGLDAQFYAGPEVMLYPESWLRFAVRLALYLDIKKVKRKAKAGACDPGEGSANTVWAAVDEYGLIEMVSEKTPDTSVIRGKTIAFCRKHDIPFERFVFDRGGGGKQIADDMRADGMMVGSIGFGERAGKLQPKRSSRTFIEKVEANEEPDAYINRRAEMYGDLAALLEVTFAKESGGTPARGIGFAIPGQYVELLRQLGLIPRKLDREGRLKIPPKSRAQAKQGEQSLEEIIGHSPDEADTLVMAVHRMRAKTFRQVAGAA